MTCDNNFDEEYLKRVPTGLLDNTILINERNLKLHCVSYKVSKPKAICFAVHGFGEHIGRAQYKYLAAELNNLQISFYGLDNQGFGQSEAFCSRKASVKNFQDYSQDLLLYIKNVSQEEHLKGKPIYAFGHSMGGGIVFETAARNPQLFSGVVLCAPSLQPHPSTAKPHLVFAVKVLSTVLPNVPVGHIEPNYVSRSETVQKEYMLDPLNWTSGTRIKWAHMFLKWNDQLVSLFDTFHTPFLLLQGDMDKIVDKSGAELLYKKSPARDKTFHMYEGYYHELLHEPQENSQRVMNDIISWFSSRLELGVEN